MWTDRLTKSNPVNRLEVSISDSRKMERDKVLTTRGSPPVLYRWEAVRQVELSKALKRTAFTASADGTFGTSHVELLALGARDLEGDFLQQEIDPKASSWVSMKPRPIDALLCPRSTSRSDPRSTPKDVSPCFIFSPRDPPKRAWPLKLCRR
jgi:hypothetical protein